MSFYNPAYVSMVTGHEPIDSLAFTWLFTLPEDARETLAAWYASKGEAFED